MSIIAPSGPASSAAAGNLPGSAAPSDPGSHSAPTTDWRSSLPEDIRGNPALASYKDIASLAKSHIHAQSFIGADKIVIPGKDATAEQRVEFFKRLGRPDDAKGYEFKAPEGVDAASVSEERLNSWRGRLHELGLTKSQGEALINAYAGEEFAAIAESKKLREDRLAADQVACQKLFGDKYDENINFVRIALGEFASDDLYKTIDEAGLSNNPHFVKAFADIGRKLAGDGRPMGTSSHSLGGSIGSPEQAQLEITRMQNDPAVTAALMDRSNPRHHEVVARRGELFKMAFPRE